MRNRHPEPAPDYTNAFLATFGLLLFMFFWVLAAVYGFLSVIATAFGLDRVFLWIGAASAGLGRQHRRRPAQRAVPVGNVERP